MFDTARRAEETETQYIWRICSAKDNGVLDITWDAVADILNKELRGDDEWYTQSAYRKKYQQAKLFKDEVFSKESRDNDEYNTQKKELERLKVQVRDERLGYNAANRSAARLDENFRYLGEQLKNVKQLNFNPHSPVHINGDRDCLILLSDLHLGAEFSSTWGSYNSQIAKDRLSQLLQEIKIIQNKHNCVNAYVSIQGDIISNSLHKTLAITNRENVIAQIKIAIEYVSSFIYALSNVFKEVHVTNVSGNHSRIDRKEDALHDERLDDLIGWTVKLLLKNVDNVFIYDNDIDIGIAKMVIRGKEYINCHGDYDAFTKNGVSNLCMMLGHVPYAITYGHLHTCAIDDTQGVKMIRGGCLSGSGDDYTIERRFKGKPSQMVCVCSEDGVECYYPVELK